MYDNQLYLTVDMVLFAVKNGEPHVLVIRRGTDSDAFPGYWALPGGYVDAGERIEDAARRELAEETHLTSPATWERLGVYDDPDRDPRGRVVSVAYTALLDAPAPVRAGDDAAEAEWMPTTTAMRTVLAFDHDEIFSDAHARMRSQFPPRTCTRCATTVPFYDECPTCVAEFIGRRDPVEMTTTEKLAEFDSWFRSRLPEISNNRIAQRINELVGHPAHPMDIATATGRDALRAEIAAQ